LTQPSSNGCHGPWKYTPQSSLWRHGPAWKSLKSGSAFGVPNLYCRLLFLGLTLQHWPVITLTTLLTPFGFVSTRNPAFHQKVAHQSCSRPGSVPRSDRAASTHAFPHSSWTLIHLLDCLSLVKGGLKTPNIGWSAYSRTLRLLNRPSILHLEPIPVAAP
jgi:hypothetical protein